MVVEKGEDVCYKYLELVAVLYVTALLVANTIAVKIIMVFGYPIPAGILCFPISYIIGDVLTEVYGFKNARRIILYGFVSLGLMVLLYSLASVIEPAPFWENQDAFSLIFSFVPRIALGSLVAYLVGSLLNSYYMVIIKKITRGRFLWVRTIGSTIIGEGVDSVIFNTIAFIGVFSYSNLLVIILTGWLMKTFYEVLATPFTYYVVGFLKRREAKIDF